MNALIISIAAYCLGFVFHVAIHRIFLRRKRISIVPLAAYTIPMIALQGQPATAVMMYFILVTITALLYFGVILGGETPSSMMIVAFRKRPKQTKQSLERVFTERGLVWKRVHDLVTSGLVKNQNGRYIITPQATWIAWGILSYQQLFARRHRG